MRGLPARSSFSSSSISTADVTLLCLGFFFFVAAGVIPAVDALRPQRYVDILKDLLLEREDDGGGLMAPNAVEQDPARFDDDDDDDDEPEEDVKESVFTQRVDHFDALNMRTYQQRYFYSDRYVLKDNISESSRSLTFLCVGGEGPGFTKAVLVDSVHCTGDMIELAKRLFESYHISVHMYALEHRYYGESYPDFGPHSSPVATPNLRFLSSRQALEDLAHFAHTMQQQQHQHQHQHHEEYQESSAMMPWVTFGGSYPGYMAGNARLKYPHLIFAAVSNSAPLDLKVDFPGYNRRVGWDLQYEAIGGSQECFDVVKNGHNQAVALLQEDPARLGVMFHVCEPDTILLDKRNQNLLVGDGLIGIYAQGNDPSCTTDLCNIDKLCSFMLASLESPETTELEVLAQVAEKQRGGGGDDDDNTDDCLSVDFEKMLEELAKPVVQGFGWRSWLWQTCTEVGFYQTCDETCPYASFYHTVDQDLAICEAAYNITNVYDNVQATRDHYGGLDINAGSKLLSVNGDVDPWSVLGLHSSPKYSLPVEIVAGASHHFWTHAVKDSDATEIVKIREYIYTVIMDWLDIEETDNVDESGDFQSVSSLRRVADDETYNVVVVA